MTAWCCWRRRGSRPVSSPRWRCMSRPGPTRPEPPLPLKAVLANLVSVGAAYGALVLIWQQGHGSEAIWGLPASGAITAWIPLFVFAFLYGLSMDYEVFLLS